METKLDRLQAILRDYGRVAVALSGGVDSTTLAAVAVKVLGVENVVALTVRSPLQTQEEIESAMAIATELGIRHLLHDVNELTIPKVANNDARRCYYCKRARFLALVQAAAVLGNGYTLVHGENADDAHDYRPGALAAKELDVRAPLAQAGMTKSDVRSLARELDLATWDRPAAPCLATRFGIGRRLSPEGLGRVGAAEAIVRSMLDVDDCRVRDEDETARIELEPDAMARAVSPAWRKELVRELRGLGYKRITLDLAGYKMGSMNDGI